MSTLTSYITLRIEAVLASGLATGEDPESVITSIISILRNSDAESLLYKRDTISASTATTYRVDNQSMDTSRGGSELVDFTGGINVLVIKNLSSTNELTVRPDANDNWVGPFVTSTSEIRIEPLSLLPFFTETAWPVIAEDRIVITNNGITSTALELVIIGSPA